MCGRFTLRRSASDLADDFELEELPLHEPRYNIAPTQPVGAILMTPDQGDRQFRLLHWGLIPSWAKDPKMGAKMINARSETVAEKPSFRNAFKRRRCLIPADGFYEWQRKDNGKQPYYFQVSDRPVLAFAGLWEHWHSREGDEIESCTILTTSPNELLNQFHDRMPVILHEQDYDLWLDPEMQQTEPLQSLLRPYNPDTMQAHPVRIQVNNPRYDAPDCIEPIAPDPAATASR